MEYVKYNNETRQIEVSPVDDIEQGDMLKVLACVKIGDEYKLCLGGGRKSGAEIHIDVSQSIYDIMNPHE